MRRAAVLLPAGAALAALLAAAFVLPPQAPPGASFTPPEDDICIVPPPRGFAATPYDPASGLPVAAARAVPADARCPICGMYPARYPGWAAQLIFTDGAAHFFDSPVDLLLFLADPGRYDVQRADAGILALYVSDHQEGGWIDARTAHFVSGSSATGPMRGPDLPAFRDAGAATTFAARHGGEVLVFEAITPERLATLRAATHPH
ncbi:hypothetical protein E6C76_01760 [Pseudothauera nasutitermitis]|uniref:NosL n=1 Tax=Pseudothauera nasutitermitis TaxID=2565930 RepID=A0A4S4B3A2_9RHOO|nr:nitrous oxide reductase accessory protein NosL [Pseudothauera nasutitermitis]THF67137.1 hypothetical protein E6C76_01760 [Pseudothauera nasutitermitis]